MAGLNDDSKIKEIENKIRNDKNECWNVKMKTALIDGYGECMNLKECQRIFNECMLKSQIDRAIINAMMKSYNINQCYNDALLLFEQINNKNIKCDRITFMAALQVLL